MEGYDLLKYIGAILAIMGGIFGLWKFLIQPVWRVINSILETLKTILEKVGGFTTSIGILEAIIPRMEKNINEMGIKYEKKIADLQKEVNALKIDVATLKQKTNC